MVNNFNTAHFRGVAKALNPFSNNGWTEKDFSTNELNEYRQAVYNKIYEQKHREDLGLKKKFEELGRELDTTFDIDKELANNIRYENYSPMYVFDQYGNVNKARFTPAIKNIHELNQVLFNPSYSAQMSVGSADFDVDKYGNVVLRDIYNVNKGTGLANPLLNTVHETIKLLGKPYPININLGNINDWNMGYTGNQLLGIQAEPKEYKKIQDKIIEMKRQNELNKMRI